MLSSLVRANQGILKQKIGLIEALVTKHGPDAAKATFQQRCPIAQASIGQHIRHSMDHLERATSSFKDSSQPVIHYDLRQRGESAPDESDMDLAQTRIQRVLADLDRLSHHQEDEAKRQELEQKRVQACFMLSGDDETEFPLPSTLARELAFCAHHAIHHMAMVRIIATTSGGLLEKDIPHDFGRAPSTVNFDRKTAS